MIPHQLIRFEQKDAVKLICTIDMKRLFPAAEERRRFDERWEAFLASDPCNAKIFSRYKDTLRYESEQLIPQKTDDRPPLLLVLGNPASHSVHAGMFFAFAETGNEHRFWKTILAKSGILELSMPVGASVREKNMERRRQLLELDYESPFRIGLCVFITLPSAPGGTWGGVAGVQKLIGIKALRRLEAEEAVRVRRSAQQFLGEKGRAVVFQKNAWNALRSAADPEYSIEMAKTGTLKGSMNSVAGIELLGVPPTRLAGPCQRVLKRNR